MKSFTKFEWAALGLQLVTGVAFGIVHFMYMQYRQELEEAGYDAVERLRIKAKEEHSGNVAKLMLKRKDINKAKDDNQKARWEIINQQIEKMIENEQNLLKEKLEQLRYKNELKIIEHVFDK